MKKIKILFAVFFAILLSACGAVSVNSDIDGAYELEGMNADYVDAPDQYEALQFEDTVNEL